MDFIKKIGKEVISNTTGINLGSSSSGYNNETLYVTVIRAEGIKDKDRLTKSDPYLIVSLGGKTFRTRTIKNDLSPQWNETFTFKTSKGKSKDIHLKLKDDDYGIDDTIGTATVSAGDLPMYSGEEKYIQIPVKKSEQIHGIVHLRIKKFVEGEQSYSSTNQSSSSYPSTNQSSYPSNRSSYPSTNQSSSYQSYSQPSYQNYPPPTQYQQVPPSYYPSSNQQQAPYYGQPPYQQQQQQQQPQGYPSVGTYPQMSSSSYPTGYNQHSQQQQYPYQQYNQQGYNQGYHR